MLARLKTQEYLEKEVGDKKKGKWETEPGYAQDLQEC
jgi:hypothetical protein